MKFQNIFDLQTRYLPGACCALLEAEGLYCPDGFPAPEWDGSRQRETISKLGN